VATELKKGDRVRHLEYTLAGASPEWRGRTATVIDLLGPYPGQGDGMFARLRMDDDGSERDGISCHRLELLI